MYKLSLIGLMGLTMIANAANVTQVNRYATVENKPSMAQINPLLSVQQIHFSQDIQTIEQALLYWLQYSGFHLAPTNKQSDSLKLVLKQPIPQVNRNLGPLTVKDGLEVLVGKSVFTLGQDQLLREVNFRRKA
ncbi:hypothetical protein Lsan_3888 [Legionella santicrucis]|uniref:Integrating conjugative element protein PilL, PFGI-1 class n=1 Tax=Legionella santicrucis TaxID=45074 RepID=A0A0W0YA48_9GAMM|nr:hypothetical protein [Legionella santicrucis]KTD53478.1 hypothetical protein Lsan_3888 [Legionella santicrucis]